MKKRKTKRRRSALVDILNGVLSLVILAIIAVVGVVMFAAHEFYQSDETQQETTFQIHAGTGLSTIAARLEDAGLIDNRWVFQFGALANSKAREIKAGEFRIARGASMADILTEITEGEPITYSVTVPEGFTSWQVVERVRARTELTGDIETVPEEGTLLPDTYIFQRGDERSEIIQRMRAAQDEALAEIWASREPDLPLETPEDLVTLASIVEKETGVPDERPEVAAVFINRLERGMRLQSDPTIIYGITNGEGALGRGLTRSEIEEETPYNTYVVDGLPAGPIANPGIEAMRAVANPAESDALYFVAAGANPSQGHVFAQSYDEHRENVAQYRAALEEAAAVEGAEAEAARDELQAEEAEQAGNGAAQQETEQ